MVKRTDSEKQKSRERSSKRKLEKKKDKEKIEKREKKAKIEILEEKPQLNSKKIILSGKIIEKDDSTLKDFLINPWKRDIIGGNETLPFTNLENELPPQEFKEDEENNNYLVKKETETSYIKPNQRIGTMEELYRKPSSEKEKGIIEEHKKNYLQRVDQKKSFSKNFEMNQSMKNPGENIYIKANEMKDTSFKTNNDINKEYVVR